MYLDRHKEMHF